jgi:putative acetyltransferase
MLSSKFYFMPVILRQIEEKDNAPLAKLIREVFCEFGIDKSGTVYDDPTTDKLFELFQTENSAYWVAEENGKLLGGCGVYPTHGLPNGCAELVKFYLAPNARGEGIGRLLMQIINNTARSFGYKKLYLESFPELTGAVSIYKKQNYRFINAPLGNSGHHACTIWMVKELV